MKLRRVVRWDLPQRERGDGRLWVMLVSDTAQAESIDGNQLHGSYARSTRQPTHLAVFLTSFGLALARLNMS
jgi:hypothetical protein